MNIRRAEEKDSEKVLELLSEVLEIHADIRPDLFISGTTKYSKEELLKIFANDESPVYVAVDEQDEVLGYCFCILENPAECQNMIHRKTLYIDDLCVDENCRGQKVGENLFAYVKEEAKKMGCYNVTLHVWEGNDKARGFYDHMGMGIRKTQMENIL